MYVYELEMGITAFPDSRKIVLCCFAFLVLYN